MVCSFLQIAEKLARSAMTAAMIILQSKIQPGSYSGVEVILTPALQQLLQRQYLDKYEEYCIMSLGSATHLQDGWMVIIVTQLQLVGFCNCGLPQIIGIAVLLLLHARHAHAFRMTSTNCCQWWSI